MELQLNPEQMTKTTEVLMNIYNGFCLSFPYYIPKLTLARKVPNNSSGTVSKSNIVISGIPTTTGGCAVTLDVSTALSGSNAVSTAASSVPSDITGITVTPDMEATTVTTTTSVTTATTSLTTAAATEETSVEMKTRPVSTSDKPEAAPVCSQVKSATSQASDETETVGKNHGKDKSTSVEQISPRKIVTRSGRVSIPTPNMLSLMSKSRLSGGKESRKKDASKSSDRVAATAAPVSKVSAAPVSKVSAALVSKTSAAATSEEDGDDKEEEDPDDDDDIPDDDDPDDEYMPPSKRTRCGRPSKDKKAQMTSSSKKTALDLSRRLTPKLEMDSQASFFDSIDKVGDSFLF